MQRRRGEGSAVASTLPHHIPSTGDRCSAVPVPALVDIVVMVSLHPNLRSLGEVEQWITLPLLSAASVRQINGIEMNGGQDIYFLFYLCRSCASGCV